ncbi:MAG: hypothetical protein ACR2JW_03415 [Thermomicrobiales bacterium]
MPDPDAATALLDENAIAEVSAKATELLEKIKNADEASLQADPSFFRYHTFTDQNARRTLPSACDDLALLCFEYFGRFYTFDFIHDGSFKAAINLRYNPSAPSIADMTQYLIGNLNDASRGNIQPAMTFFIPMSGIGVRTRLPLGAVTIISRAEAQASVEAGQSDPRVSHMFNTLSLPGDVYARVEVGRATAERQVELLREYAQDGIDLWRYWQHHLRHFDPVNNRPQVGTPPLAHALFREVGGTPTDIPLYAYSVGQMTMGDEAIRHLNTLGFADMIEWQDAPQGSARYATTIAARRLGHAWSLLNVEDRILASFRAFEGWLLSGSESKGEILSRRLAVLMSNDPSSIVRLKKEINSKLYYRVRSAVTHGGDIRENYIPWVDLWIVRIGVQAVLRAIPRIREADDTWSIGDFRAYLDAQVPTATQMALSEQIVGNLSFSERLPGHNDNHEVIEIEMAEAVSRLFRAEARRRNTDVNTVIRDFVRDALAKRTKNARAVSIETDDRMGSE